MQRINHVQASQPNVFEEFESRAEQIYHIAYHKIVIYTPLMWV